MIQLTLLLVLAANTTSQPASRPAPDLSRMDAARLRSYAIGLWNRVAYLEAKLADAQRTIDALRKEVANGDARAIEDAKEIVRLRAIEAEYRGTPAGKAAEDMEAAVARGELRVGMTAEQVRRILNGGTVESQSGETTVMEFGGVCDGPSRTCEVYHCYFKNGKLTSWLKRTVSLPPLRMTR